MPQPRHQSLVLVGGNRLRHVSAPARRREPHQRCVFVHRPLTRLFDHGFIGGKGKVFYYDRSVHEIRANVEPLGCVRNICLLKCWKCWIQSLGQVPVEEYRVYEGLEASVFVVTLYEVVVHEVDLAPVGLERDARLDKVIPQTVQVCKDFGPPITRFADIGQVHEIEFDDVIQARPFTPTCSSCRFW